MKMLGKKIKWGSVLSARQPSFASVPQLQAGGERPSPIKLKVDSDKIADGTVKVKATMIGPIALGKICLRIIASAPRPLERAASTNSSCLSCKNIARTNLAVPIQLIK